MKAGDHVRKMHVPLAFLLLLVRHTCPGIRVKPLSSAVLRQVLKDQVTKVRSKGARAAERCVERSGGVESCPWPGGVDKENIPIAAEMFSSESERYGVRETERVRA